MAGIADLVYIDSTGYHYPDYPTVLSYFQNEFRAIYGADTYLEADSQDGQWVAILAQACHDSMALGASVYNAFSPSTAQGVGLSRNVKINGITRREATFSTVDLTIIGQEGTVITNGIVEDILSQKWLLPSPVVIPDTGTITVTATAELAGAVGAAASTVNKIATPTLGWQTVNNVLAAVLGAPIETDAELRRRQTFSTALPSLSVFDGTVGAVAQVDGVTRYKGYENDSGTTDGEGIPAHSIAIVVEGGDAQDIGDAIAVHKTPGTRTYGTTTVNTVDEYGNINPINFFRPTVVPIEVEINIDALIGYTSDYADLIKQAVADYINALDIGDDVLFTKLYVPANLPGTMQGATFDIISIEISRDADPVAAANVVIAFNEAASCDIADITITVAP